jgi:imidazolonepropionase-like amidohydrolase
MIAITNGKVMTITQGTFERGTVLIEDGRIVAVGAQVEIPAGAEVYDATGKTVVPGLIDAHCHVGLFPDGIGWEHADGNEMTDPVTPHMRALDAVHPEDPAFKQPDRRAVGLCQDCTQAECRADGAPGAGRHEDGAGRES